MTTLKPIIFQTPELSKFIGIPFCAIVSFEPHINIRGQRDKSGKILIKSGTITNPI